MLAQNDQERERYEARIKQQRDERSRLIAAEMGGVEKGRKEERREGLIRTIHFCQRFLQQPLTSQEALLALPDEELNRLAEQLQEEVLCWRNKES
jgi:hypothetical protein